MSQENQSCLRFSLEESLWFRKGQEVAELVSISLDPDITIQENDQYVTIRGSLELTGEYKSYEASDEKEVEDTSAQKYVERVEKQEEGSCGFSHRFPVDITIPNNRIQSIYDIDVIVESFDYSFPERSCIKLSAELTISGLYDSSQQAEAIADVGEDETEIVVHHRYEMENEEEMDQENEEESFEDTFLFEAEARKQVEVGKENVETFPTFPTFTYQPQVEYFEPELDIQEVRSEGKPHAGVVEEQEIMVEHEPNELLEVDVVVVEESSSSPEAPPKHEKKKKAVKKKSMTLTEFFARKEENSDQARLKVCIVQKGDTLDSLAERYDVSVANLLRENNIELNQDVFEGQVLYVPVAISQK